MPAPGVLFEKSEAKRKSADLKVRIYHKPNFDGYSTRVWREGWSNKFEVIENSEWQTFCQVASILNIDIVASE